MKKPKDYLSYASKKLAEIIASLIIGAVITVFWGFFVAWVEDKWAMIQAYWQVFQDALYSGYVRATPFRIAEGQWALAFRVNSGQPLLFVMWPYIFAIVSISGLSLLVAYLTLKCRRFLRLKNASPILC
jgi:hypothetical protein